MLFVGMIVFQLSGALILLLNCVKCGKETVIKNCFPGSNFVERDGNNNCKIEKEKLQKSVHNIYLNMIAFADLVVGYILAVFSPTSTTKTCLVLLTVIVLTCVLLVVEYFLSLFCAKIKYANDMVITFKNLDGVDTFATNKEIEAMFNDECKE
jgi:hypothetical protein